MASVPIAEEERRILDSYYAPAPNFTGYYVPFRASGRKKRWVNSRYPDTTLQRIRTDKFNSALMHDRQTNNWGWRSDYVDELRKRLGEQRIPSVHLAAWLYRIVDFQGPIVGGDLARRMFDDFAITAQEMELFEPLHESDFHEAADYYSRQPIDWRKLRTLIGTPPGTPPEEGGTLGHLEMRRVGPAAEIDMVPGERLNIVTGDNGFGKSFLLETAWWALTRDWIDNRPALPSEGATESTIICTIGTADAGETVSTAYDWSRQSWRTVGEPSVLPGLVLFARADGSFALWDPARRAAEPDEGGFVYLTRAETRDGKQTSRNGRTTSISEGLVRDWITWQHSAERVEITILEAVLKDLSPPEFQPPLHVGSPASVPGDMRLVPTIRHPYGDVPITYTSAGISRIVTLAYLLVWSWTTHVRLSALARRPPQERIIFFIDEIEAHLHPKWQRAIVPALLHTIQNLQSNVNVQLFVATHAPLVLASIEAEFDTERDRIFHMDVDNRSVRLHETSFTKYGDVDSWLRSELFGLRQPRSIEAEEAIEEAKKLQIQKNPSATAVRNVQHQLEQALGAHDDFWPRWRYFAEEHGVSD